jgi:hypothetical protein
LLVADNDGSATELEETVTGLKSLLDAELNNMNAIEDN